MAFELNVDGMTEISDLLSRMEDAAPKAAARGLYEGAGIMADEIRKSAAGIQTVPFKYAGNGESRMPSPEEKEIVQQAAMGIARFDKNGTEVNTSVGYRNAGYAEVNGKTKPIPMIVNAINSGTSFMRKQPFVRKAVKTGGTKAMKAMQDAIEAEFEAVKQK